MPQLGETVAEGKITKWFKAAGDAVKPGENLFEIETDKTSMEVPATSAGMLTDIHFQVGEVAKVGAVVAVISGGGEVPANASPFAEGGNPAAPPRVPAARCSGRANPRSSRAPSRSIRSARCARPNAITVLQKCRAAPSPPHWRAGWPASAAST